MRASAFLTLALLTLNVAAPAVAADLGPPKEHHRHGVRGRPAGPLVVYDFEPGVVVRAYWLAPWRNRHYYPSTGEQPISGRNEAIPPDGRELPEPAEKFYRMWSTSELFARDAPLVAADASPVADPEPGAELSPSLLPPSPSTSIRPDILPPGKRQ